MKKRKQWGAKKDFEVEVVGAKEYEEAMAHS